MTISRSTSPVAETETVAKIPPSSATDLEYAYAVQYDNGNALEEGTYARVDLPNASASPPAPTTNHTQAARPVPGSNNNNTGGNNNNSNPAIEANVHVNPSYNSLFNLNPNLVLTSTTTNQPLSSTRTLHLLRTYQVSRGVRVIAIIDAFFMLYAALSRSGSAFGLILLIGPWCGFRAGREFSKIYSVVYEIFYGLKVLSGLVGVYLSFSMSDSRSPIFAVIILFIDMAILTFLHRYTKLVSRLTNSERMDMLRGKFVIREYGVERVDANAANAGAGAATGAGPGSGSNDEIRRNMGGV